MILGRKIINIFIGLSLVLVVWEGLILTGKYESALLPSPIIVLQAISDLVVSGLLFTHIKVSLIRFFYGYVSAVILAIGFGLILGWFEKIGDLVDPIFQVLRPISPIAWFPFIVLLLGIGDIPAIVIIAIAAFFPVLLTTISAVKKIRKLQVQVEHFGKVEQ